MIQVHPGAVVHPSAALGKNVVIGPNCVVESNVSIEDGSILDSNVVISKGVQIGSNNHFFPNCVIGCMPQILGFDNNTKLGKLIIGNNNTFREQVTIHPSMHPDKSTIVGSGNLLMVGVHIGHDCLLEDKIVMSNHVQISGHCKIEKGVWFSGMASMHQFVTIGKWSYVAGLAGINHDIPPFVIVSGHYPPLVRSLNKRGMSRAGLNEEQQEKLSEAFKKLYRTSNQTLLSRAKALAAEDGLDENVKAMTDIIIRSNEHRFGRYLETLRH